MYNDLAVKSDWKPEFERVVQYRVKEGVELPVQVGPVGPQIDVQVYKYLPGGASQIQMLVEPANRMDYLDIVSVRYLE